VQIEISVACCLRPTRAAAGNSTLEIAIMDFQVSPLSYGDWQRRAASIEIEGRAFIDGRYVAALSGRTFATINPATGLSLAEIAACDHLDVDLAVKAARRAFDCGSWSRAPRTYRKRVLLRLAELIVQHREELAVLESVDMGKLVQDAVTLDIPGSAEVFQWYAETCDKVYDEVAPTDDSALAMITREPLGVVGAVVPWNFPLKMAAWKCAPALAAGNSVVLKPAEQSPLTAIRLAALAAEAGVPDGVFNVLPGLGPEAGKAIGLHPDIDCAAFTGSTEVGKLFLEYAGRSNMKQVWLECGGKSANIILPDCDVATAAKFAAQGIFFNQGEVCSANSRLLVHRGIKDELLDALVGNARSYMPGDPLDPNSRMGALVDEAHTRRVMDYIEDGKRTSTLLFGGDRVAVKSRGCFVAPTIFDNVDPSAAIATDEIFGPVLSVIPFDDERALEIANRSIYGLVASVWSNDITKAHRLARRLRVGTVSINTVDAVNVVTPFGGVKQSGTGRDLSLHALEKYTALKTTWVSL
jgi:gamma-glutamyl-gamma-aminobutyraldehyde dehydrogenase